MSVPRESLCFNPSVGILWGGTGMQSVYKICIQPSFNPSVGILWGGTPPWVYGGLWFGKFQSLGRDSVGWDLIWMNNPSLFRMSFNPSVGILWGGTVSEYHIVVFLEGFNPSVGILWGGTQGLSFFST